VMVVKLPACLARLANKCIPNPRCLAAYDMVAYCIVPV
jgi:hypothetical protein